MKTKKLIAIFLVIILVILTGCKKKKQEETAPVVQLEEAELPVNKLDLSFRPFVFMEPVNNAQTLTLSLENIKTENDINYELLYNSDSGRRGIIGTIEPKNGSFYKDDLDLGSRSKNVLKADKNVTDGYLLLKYTDADKSRLQLYFSLFGQVKNDKLVLESGHSLKLGSTAAADFVFMETSGLPEDIEGTVLAGPVGIFPESTKLSASSLSLEMASPSNNVQVFHWTEKGGAWSEIKDSKHQDSSAEFAIDSGGVYVVVGE